MPAATIPTAGIDVRSTLGTIAILPGDPTVRLGPGRFERATITPEGVGTIRASWTEGDPAAQVETAGDGAEWLLARAGRLLGCDDDVVGFEPTTQPLRDLWRRHRGDRIARTGTLWHDLAWFIVQQRINTTDAATQWRRLVTDLGSPAPGASGLTVPPSPPIVAGLTYHHFHRYGIERQRADHLRNAARAVTRLHSLVDGGGEPALTALRTVRGIGPWTASCVAAQTWGERDTVIVGDDGIPSTIAWLLAREPRADDIRMLELLEPYRPHRYRVLRLAIASGVRPPRRHPRARRDDIRRR